MDLVIIQGLALSGFLSQKAVFDLTADPWEYHNLIDTPKGKEVLKWAIEEHKKLKNM